VNWNQTQKQKTNNLADNLAKAGTNYTVSYFMQKVEMYETLRYNGIKSYINNYIYKNKKMDVGTLNTGLDFINDTNTNKNISRHYE